MEENIEREAKSNDSTAYSNLGQAPMQMQFQKPSGAFVMASWVAAGVGVVGFLLGLYRATAIVAVDGMIDVKAEGMALSEKGYYLTVLMFGLFSVISVQKAVRDRLEGVPVTDIFYGISWFSTILSIVLLAVGLSNANIEPSEKGFYAFGFLLSIFGAICVQKNTRDSQ